MTDTPTRPGAARLPSDGFSDRVADIAAFDPGVAGYKFSNLSEIMRFGDVMAMAGAMLPPHLRGQGALCVAVTMRAINWGFDPFALAGETYLAKDGGMLGYQGKVFAAVARNNGITLRYAYSGSFRMENRPGTSSGGKETSRRSAVGDRQVRVWAEVHGEILEYDSPCLDDITIKNSPLWHNDPDQQLAYYGARGWMRRHRPDLMMGAISDDEAEAQRELRDITPTRTSGFQALAQSARAERARTQEEVRQDPPQDVANDEDPVDVEAVTIDRASPAFELGVRAGREGFFQIEDVPNKDDAEFVANWQAGYREGADKPREDA